MGVSLYCAALSSAEDKVGESIFKYKKELSITDAQENNLHSILLKLQNSLAEKQKELDVLRVELNQLITDKADLGIIKAKVQNIAHIQADATYEDIVSVRAIESELTPDQLFRWRGMQDEFRKKLQQAQADLPQETGVAQ